MKRIMFLVSLISTECIVAVPNDNGNSQRMSRRIQEATGEVATVDQSLVSLQEFKSMVDQQSKAMALITKQRKKIADLISENDDLRIEIEQLKRTNERLLDPRKVDDLLHVESQPIGLSGASLTAEHRPLIRLASESHSSESVGLTETV